MKKRSISKWAQGISTGILVTVLSLMACTVNTQAEPVKVGENWVIPLPQGVELDMVWIKPGTFTMGISENELSTFIPDVVKDIVKEHEMPHQVTLTKGYWLGKYEVTQRQWKAVMESNPSEFEGDDLPVEQVSWEDAMEFCRKLTEWERNAERLPSGYEYTLPTEAQWEYACRAGTTSSLNSGKDVTTDDGICDDLDEVGWYWMNGGKKNWNGGKNPAICTHPGGQKKPNNWGLYDMHGNVREWCLDWYGDYPTSSVTDPKGANTGKDRVFRGGSWDSLPRGCRSALRGSAASDKRNHSLGFRLAISFNFTVSEYRKLAEQGDADAQNKLAFCYYEGEDVEKDLKEALKWWTKAAEQGLAKAQNNLGEMYLYGEGTEKDLDQARKWFRKAADQGHAEAKKNLERLKD